jgi:excisionase family DNA binding protein
MVGTYHGVNPNQRELSLSLTDKNSTTSALEGLPEMLKVEEAAKVLRIGRNQAYDLVRDGSIRCVHLGRSIRVPRCALVAMLEGLAA